ELPCTDGTKAFHKLQAICKDRNVGLVIEGNAQAALRKGDARPGYVVYLDGILPEELAELLVALGAQERKGKPADAQFEMAVVRRAGDPDRKELNELFGLDPLPQTPKEDPSNPPRAPSARPAGKAAEYQALVVSYNLVRPPKGAPEVKRFFDGRKPPRPGALHVMLLPRAAPQT